jgi:hypothetical protein
MNTPPGFTLQEEILTPSEEASLIELVHGYQLPRVPMRGGYLRRRLLCFGIDFGPGFMTLREAPPIPAEFASIRETAARFVGLPPERLTQAIVQLYPPGASIGWHCDDDALGSVVIGISLQGNAKLRFALSRTASRDEVVDVAVPPRSIYVMRDAARYRWLHSVAPVKDSRISITFRNASIQERLAF